MYRVLSMFAPEVRTKEIISDKYLMVHEGVKEKTIMKKETNKILTLDQPAIYQIKVPGHLDTSWLDSAGGITTVNGSDDDGTPYTTLTCTVDQSALLGLLRRLYSLGVPLISVICLEVA